MKKLYIQPETIVCEAMPAQMLAGSLNGVVIDLDDQETDGPGFGGVDDGSHTPGAKGDWGDIWD